MRAARRDPHLVLLEGVHALKHAVRFDADVEVVVTADPDALDALLDEVAPDVRARIDPTIVDAGTWGGLVARELPSPVVAVARRPRWTPETVLARPGRVVALEEPRHLGNLGAVVRVAAAAGAAGVLVIGDADPWHPTAVRAGAGLQFAIGTVRAEALPDTGDRPVVALDAERTEALDAERTDALDAERTVAVNRTDPARGATTGAWPLPPDAVVLVGTERAGLSATLRARAGATAAIPMRPGVSSLNLATAVAVALYADVTGASR